METVLVLIFVNGQAIKLIAQLQMTLYQYKRMEHFLASSMAARLAHLKLHKFAYKAAWQT